jgi:hypothetical protein
MTSDMNGNIYVADPGYVVIRKITPSGQVSSFLTPTSNTSSGYLIKMALKYCQGK